MKQFEQNYPITINDRDLSIHCEYTFTPGRPAVMYSRNGDPGYPEEPAEIDILSMKAYGEALPQWLVDLISEDCYTWLMEHHDGE